MKKVLIIVAIIFFMVTIVSAASITVTNPPSPNPQWMHAVTHPILWQSSGTLSGNLNIDLLNAAGTNKIKTLFTNVNKTSHQKNWTPSSNISAGTYRIKVSTPDGQVFGKSAQFQIVTNPNILYTTAQLQGTVTGPSVPGKNVRRAGGIMAPNAKPKIIIIKFKNVPYSENMTTPMCTSSQPIKIFISAICSSTPIKYRVVISLANPTQPGVQIRLMKDTGWKTNGSFSIFIPTNDLAPIMEGAAIPTYFKGEVQIHAKAGNPEKFAVTHCKVKFTN